jgi:aminopeptidase
MDYIPEKKIIEKYADVIINFALNSGKGIKKNEVVFLQVPECAKPLLIEMQKAVLRAGAHYITNYMPDETSRHFYEFAEEHQLNFFPEKHLRGRIDQADHMVFIEAETNKKELEGIDAKKIMMRQKSHRPYMEWRDEKEAAGKFTWTIALYGTEAMAEEAGISLEEYWNQIIKACYLEYDNPIEKWREAFVEIDRVKDKLNNMKIARLRVKSAKNDFIVGLGEGRKWLGGSGRNIPSFELFISPDKRITEGHVYFDQPLYRYGNLIKGVYMKFEKGKVIEIKAEKGEDVIKEMISVEGADMIGEFSLTDKRLSKIDRFMAETLYDENFGGKYGNTHMALGKAYKDSYPGDASKLTKEDWEKLGYNESAVHTDIISTEDRIVEAELSDGTKKIIYKDGMFVI